MKHGWSFYVLREIDNYEDGHLMRELANVYCLTTCKKEMKKLIQSIDVFLMLSEHEIDIQ